MRTDSRVWGRPAGRGCGTAVSSWKRVVSGSGSGGRRLSSAGRSIASAGGVTGPGEIGPGVRPKGLFRSGSSSDSSSGGSSSNVSPVVSPYQPPASVISGVGADRRGSRTGRSSNSSTSISGASRRAGAGPATKLSNDAAAAVSMAKEPRRPRASGTNVTRYWRDSPGVQSPSLQTSVSSTTAASGAASVTRSSGLSVSSTRAASTGMTDVFVTFRRSVTSLPATKRRGHSASMRKEASPAGPT